MATVHVELSRVQGRALTGSTLPVPDSVALNAASQASTGGWVASTVVAAQGEVWSITAAGGDVLVRFDPDPATGNNGGVGRRICAGATRDFIATTAAEKVAIKDAA